MAWSSRNGNFWQAGVTLTKVSETDTSITLKYTALFRSDYAIEVKSSITWSMSTSGAYSWSDSSGGEAEGKYISSENDSSVTLYTKQFTVNKTTSSQTVTAKNTVKVTSVSSGTQTATASYTIPAKTSYTVSYNANGGSGAPSADTKWHGTALSLDFSTIPTRTGYTFLGYSTSSTATSATWTSSSKSYTANASDTLYAVWQEHYLTVNYYSNYATSAFDDALNTVGSDKNVKVYTANYYYDNDYSTYGLANYSGSSGSVYMTRTGYTATGNWGTSTSGGTLVNENTGYATGQALARALGKDLSSGNASVNLYAQWKINTYTISYNANGGSGAMNSQTVEWGEDFTIATNTFTREGYKCIGYNVKRSSDNTWYVPTQKWTSEADIASNGYIKKVYAEGEDGHTMGTSWTDGTMATDTFTFYVVWELSGVVYIDNGKELESYVVYIDNGSEWEQYIPYMYNGLEWYPTC